MTLSLQNANAISDLISYYQTIREIDNIIIMFINLACIYPIAIYICGGAPPSLNLAGKMIM